MMTTERKPLSQAIAVAAETAEEIAIAMGYADASRFLQPLMQGLPDGHIAVGAMDGWTIDVPVRA